MFLCSTASSDVISASTENLYFVLLIIVGMEKEIMHIKSIVENRHCEMFCGSSGQALYHTYHLFSYVEGNFPLEVMCP